MRASKPGAWLCTRRSTRSLPPVQNGGPPDQDPKYRNYVIAAAVGGFLLPAAGAVGAAVFASRGDQRSARIVGITSVIGLIVYVVLFALL